MINGDGNASGKLPPRPPDVRKPVSASPAPEPAAPVAQWPPKAANVSDVGGLRTVQGPKQRGMAQILETRTSTDVLRKLDHVEWLENFAKVMQMETGVQMTPMRMGVINRCRLAADYIRLLRGDAAKLHHDLGLALLEIDRQKRELTGRDDADADEGR